MTLTPSRSSGRPSPATSRCLPATTDLRKLPGADENADAVILVVIATVAIGGAEVEGLWA